MSGIKSFQERMAAIPREVRRSVKPALLQGAYEIADAMEALAPEDTGDLKGSIAVTAPGQSTPPYSQPGGSQIAPPNAALVTAGNTDVRYPHLAEYGTSDTSAQPFFWPGYRLAKKKAAARVKRSISKAVREAK